MIELKLTKEEYNLVISALMELPAKVSMEFVLKLDKVVKEQLAKAKKPD